MNKIDLSDLSVEVLIEASKSYDGMITITPMFGHIYPLQTNSRRFSGAEGREEANNKRTIKELEGNGLIDCESDTIYKLSADGYDYADHLRAEEKKEKEDSK